MYDILIKNGHIIDGTGSPAMRAQIAVKDGKIVKIARHIDGSAAGSLRQGNNDGGHQSGDGDQSGTHGGKHRSQQEHDHREQLYFTLTQGDDLSCQHIQGLILLGDTEQVHHTKQHQKHLAVKGGDDN